MAIKSSQGPRRAVAALAATALLAVVGSADAKVVMRLDYESGNFQQWRGIHARPGGAKIVRSPRHQGRYGARFKVGQGDDPIDATGERAEVFSLTGERAGTSSWWKWSTRFPRSFRPSANDWNVFTQWHNSGDTCAPSVSFVVDAHERPHRLKLKVNSGYLNQHRCVASTSRNYSLGRLRRGKWLTFVLHVGWSPNRNGFVQVWRNGKRVVRRKQVPTLYFGQSVYVKQGYYRYPEDWTTFVYHDGLRRFSRRPPRLR